MYQEEWLSLKGKIVKYLNMSLSSILNKNEKVKQYIKNKIHKT